MIREATILAVWLGSSMWLYQPLAFASAECDTTAVLTGQQYWMWRGYFGIDAEQTTGGLIVGRRVDDPGICFEVAEKLVRNPDAAYEGLSHAMYEWFTWLPVSNEPAELADPDVQKAIEGLRRLTGQRFETRSEWQQWLDTNRHYLRYSSKEGGLVVDRVAKQSGRPVQFPDLPTMDGTATEYWYYEGLGWIRESLSDSQEFRVWAGDGERILKVSGPIDLSAAKESGYLSAAELLINDRLTIEYLGDDSLQEIIARLRAITDQNFGSAEQWLSWWARSRTQLVLSEDGTRLVINGRES